MVRLLKTNNKEEIFSTARHLPRGWKTIQMIADFHIRTHGGQEEVAQHFSGTEKMNCQLRIWSTMKNPYQIKIRAFSDEGQLKRIYHQYTFLKRIAKGNSLNGKEMVKDRIFFF